MKVPERTPYPITTWRREVLGGPGPTSPLNFAALEEK
jgi:hypothetical protein